MKFGILVFGIRKSAQGIRNPSSTDEESAIQVPLTRNPKRGILNPRLSWITSQGATHVRIDSGDFVTRYVPAFLEGEAFC